MLYLVRKLNESIIINNDVELEVVEIKRNSVKLGFKFSQSSTVYRKETHERIMKQNQEALELGSKIEAEAASSEDTDS